MKNVVLGWCRTGAPCPGDIQQTVRGPLTIVSLTSRRALTPRARMHQQVCCFEAGMNLLPVAPRTMFHLNEAMSLETSKNLILLEKLEKISGFGQLTLRLTSPQIEVPKVLQSEQWLRERQRIRVREEDRKKSLENTIRQLTFGSTQHSRVIHHAAGGIAVCHLLVPTDDQAKVKDRICSQATTAAQSLQSLYITGPWPAYAFADYCQAETERAHA